MDKPHHHGRWVEGTVAACVLLGIVLIFFHDVIFGQNVLVRSNPYLYQPWRAYASRADLARDVGDLDSFVAYLPRRVELSRSISAGRIPLWNPYIYGGTAFFADPQARVFDPIALLLVPADPARAMGYDLAIHFFIAMLGMYLFLRAIGATRPGSLVGALGYGLCSFMVGQLGLPTFVTTASWIPLIFWAFEVARRTERVGTLLLAFMFVMTYLAGMPQVLLMGVMALAVYAAYLSGEGLIRGDRWAPLRHLKILGISGLLSILLVSVHLLPFREFVGNSVGLGIKVGQMLSLVSHPLGMVRALIAEPFGSPVGGAYWAPIMGAAGYNITASTGIYCGVATLLAAVGSLVFLGRSKHVRALWCVMLLGIGLGTSGLVLRAAYAAVPFIGYADITRVAVITCFAIASLAGVGFSLFSVSGDRRVRGLFVLALALVFAFTAAVYLVLWLQGKPLAAWFVRTANQFASARGPSAMAAKVTAWVQEGGAGWLAYEKGVVARALAFAGGCLGLAVSLFLLGAGRKRLRAGLAAAFVLLVAIDLIGAAQRNYLSIPAGGFRSVPGVETLREMLGDVGRWRTTALERRREPLPANTNEIFGISSLRGRCTIVPRGVADRWKAGPARVERLRISAPDRPLTTIEDFMSVRFVLTDSLDAGFLAPPLAAALVGDKGLARHLGMFEAGGESRFAFIPSMGESLIFRMAIPSSRYLDFEVASGSSTAATGEPLRFVLVCESDKGRAVFDRVLDQQSHGDRWNAFRIDISAVGGAEGRIAMYVVPAGSGAITGGDVAWSGMEFVVDDCGLRKTEKGYELNAASPGGMISLNLISTAREIPLEVRLGDSDRRCHWILFTPHMRRRQVTIAIPGDAQQGVVIASDSAFALLSAKLVSSAFPHKLDYDMVYDKDMGIYENMAAMEKGMCIAQRGVKSEIVGKTRALTLPEPDVIRGLQCGTCSILSYEPEKVVLTASSASGCFLVFQDTYYPGWVARVDGERSEILRTNLGTRAIELAPGDHSIVMTFEPRSLKFGLGLTCLGIAMTAVYAWGRARKSSLRRACQPGTHPAEHP